MCWVQYLECLFCMYRSRGQKLSCTSAFEFYRNYQPAFNI